MSRGQYQWGRRFLPWAFGLTTLASGVALARPPSLAPPPTPSFGYGVATESPTATRDAARVLEQGGSAADAAIVAALVAGVTSPTSSGIGGGGFLVGWDAKTQSEYVVDFREQAPEHLVRTPFEERPLSRSQSGHLIGIPGEVQGLYQLHRRAGKLRWSHLVKKASSRAHRGFTVGKHLGQMIGYAQGKLQPLPGFSSLFYPNGKPALVGTRLTHPALARTLDKIAALGPDAFYQGEVAADIVKTAQAHGSPLSLSDLKSYLVKERRALRIRYAGNDVYTMPPPSAGGLMMAQVLSMFPPEYLQQLGHGTPAYQHLLAEALRGAIADRMRYLGDPDFENIDLEKLLSEERLEKRRSKISLDRTHSLPRFGIDEQGTHALVTRDRQGNAISLTTTINHLFGAKIYAENSGIILNNELNDFGDRKSVGPFSMQETPNAARPSARPVSSMTPTVVVRNGKVTLALGGSGGTAIATNATQTLLGALVFDQEPRTAVSKDRIYIPTKDAHMKVEKGTDPEHIADLERRGEIVAEMTFSGTAIQMLRVDDGQVKAGADPRKHGLAIVGR